MDGVRWVQMPAASDRSAGYRQVIELFQDDLPCPWCHAPTSESDPSCPSCGRRFG